jgi:hypothetical protein
MGLESHYPRWQAPVPGFVFEHGEHGLMAAVNPVKVADGQRAGLQKGRVLVAAKDFHVGDYRFYEPARSSIACILAGSRQSRFHRRGLPGLMLNAGFHVHGGSFESLEAVRPGFATVVDQP